MKKIWKIIIATVCLIAQVGWAADASKQSFTPEQSKAIEAIIHDYLLQNPEILIEVSQKLQQRMQEKAMQKAKEQIQAHIKPLFFAPTSPVLGNTKAVTKIVEFFDYQCIHCKQEAEIIQTLIKQNSDIQVIFKNFPIRGPVSDFAAQASIAAQMQGKFSQFHHALFKVDQPLTQDIILTTAKTSGLDVPRLKQDMKSPKVRAEIEANLELAQKLEMPGTPALVIGRVPNETTAAPVFYIPGAVNAEVLKSYIEKSK